MKSNQIKKIFSLLLILIIIMTAITFGLYILKKINNNQIQEVNQDIVGNHKLIEEEACNLDGKRRKNVKVDIGYDSKEIEREYFAYTNDYGQVTTVEAKELILQDDTKEKVNNAGRYCNDEAKVPGTESKTLDEGHIIADSLGGVGNAYNITPQDSTLNRRGSQYNLEGDFRAVLKAGGTISDVRVEITYPNIETQIPSHYKYSWNQNGSKRNLQFENKSN